MKKIVFSVMLLCIMSSFFISASGAVYVQVPVSTNSETNDTKTQKFYNDLVVYMDWNTNTYHAESCILCNEQNCDYSNPLHLSQVITDKIRCTECIPDDIYYTYMESAYKIKINELEAYNTSQLKVFCCLLILCPAMIIIKAYEKYKTNKDK